MVPVFAINLAKSRRRRRALTRSLERVGVRDYRLVRAVEGTKLPRSEFDAAIASGRYLYPSAAMVGCSFSHRNVRRHIAGADECPAVVIEDDCVPSPSFQQTVDEIARSISGRTAVLLYAESPHGIGLHRTPKYRLTHTSLFEPTEPEHLFSAMAYVVTNAAAMSLGTVERPPYEPDRWGNYLTDGLLDHVLVAHPFVAENALFASTIGHSSTALPQSVRFALDALPGASAYLRKQRRQYVDRANTPRFMD